MIQTMGQEGKPILNTAEIQQATPTSRNAMAASEEIRKIYSSGRPDAQQLVAKYIQQLKKTGV